VTKALVAMAVLQAHWDDQRDYLDNFKPFVAEHLRDWPPADPVQPTAIAQKVREDVGIELPAGVVSTLLNRLTRDGYMRRSQGQLWVVPEMTDELPALTIDRERARNEMDDLVEEVRDHAVNQLGLTGWDDQKAMSAIERFLDSLGIEFLQRRQRGDVRAWNGDRTDAAAVQSYARSASQNNERGAVLLEQAVRGSMLSTVLHYARPEGRPSPAPRRRCGLF
jgi:hypothetical protein